MAVYNFSNSEFATLSSVRISKIRFSVGYAYDKSSRESYVIENEYDPIYNSNSYADAFEAARREEEGEKPVAKDYSIATEAEVAALLK